MTSLTRNRLDAKCIHCGHVWTVVHLPLDGNLITRFTKAPCPKCHRPKPVVAGRDDLPAEVRMAEALRQCLPLLRGDLQIIFESEAVWFHRNGTGIIPDFQPLDPDSAAYAAARIAAIRAAEALVGRVPDDCPDWLNEVIDGTREWRA